MDSLPLYMKIIIMKMWGSGDTDHILWFLVRKKNEKKREEDY